MTYCRCNDTRIMLGRDAIIKCQQARKSGMIGLYSCDTGLKEEYLRSTMFPLDFKWLCNVCRTKENQRSNREPTLSVRQCESLRTSWWGGRAEKGGGLDAL